MKVLYKEEQKFQRSHVFLFVTLVSIASLVPFGIGIYKQLIVGKPWGNNPMSDLGLIIAFSFVFVLLLGVVLLFIYMKFIVEVTDDGIRFKYIPLINKWKLLEKGEISQAKIRKFKPITEYGGHGVKTGKSKSGIAYTVSGKTGLQLVMKNGKKILLGTKRPDALISAVNKMLDKYNIDPA